MLIFILLVPFVVLIVLLVGFITSTISNKNKGDRQAEFNQNILSMLKNQEFVADKTFYIKDLYSYNSDNLHAKWLLVDTKNKRCCIINYSIKTLIIVPFSQILNYEIYENGGTQTTGGAVGGFFSGLFSAETSSTCKELRLIIRLKEYNTSQVVYDIISDTVFNLGIHKTSIHYKTCIKSLQEVVSFLEVIKQENSNK